MHDAQHAAATVRRLAQDLGFAVLGIASAAPAPRADFVRQWLGAGKHGQMAFLADELEARLDPARLLPGARSFIAVADRYPSQTSLPAPPRPARIARYAWGDDYHRVIKKRLHRLADALREVYPQHQYRSAVDTAPVMERDHAARAGLGWIGKHTLLIHPRLGSWLLLGEIITTLELADAAPGQAISDHCGTCTRCLDACPTACLTPYQIDAQRCISYLTIEHEGAIDPSLHESMGDWVAGCDVCQEVCPFNRDDRPGAPPPEQGSHKRYTPRSPAPAFDLLDLLNWTPQQRQAAFTNSALKRITLQQMKRNALIAAGNALRKADDATLRRRVRQIADDESEPEVVRTTARQALS
jgi:epoxyqueuosine reductase